MSTPTTWFLTPRDQDALHPLATMPPSEDASPDAVDDWYSWAVEHCEREAHDWETPYLGGESHWPHSELRRMNLFYHWREQSSKLYKEWELRSTRLTA